MNTTYAIVYFIDSSSFKDLFKDVICAKGDCRANRPSVNYNWPDVQSICKNNQNNPLNPPVNAKPPVYVPPKYPDPSIPLIDPIYNGIAATTVGPAPTAAPIRTTVPPTTFPRRTDAYDGGRFVFGDDDSSGPAYDPAWSGSDSDTSTTTWWGKRNTDKPNAGKAVKNRH